MVRKLLGEESGQALIEYGLIAVVFVLVAVGGLSTLAPMFSKGLGGVVQALDLPGIEAPTSTAFLSIKDDFLMRLQAFYDKNGHWPRTWGDFAFTDIGLNPKDWESAVEGIYWGSHGSEVGLANKKGDNLQIYVNNLKGERLKLYDGWNIWCQAGSSACYYHRIEPGNEVDIRTLVVVKE